MSERLIGLIKLEVNEAEGGDSGAMISGRRSESTACSVVNRL
ncbi:hypothetical protein JOD21_003422 [Jeotgalibacillus terrae]|nr:hypothetical protein [Jeotgalibacillus terrae]